MQLYYSPLACSLAAHMVCREAGLDFTLHRSELVTKRVEDGRDLRAVNPMGQVPTLVTDDGRVLTENSAVLYVKRTQDVMIVLDRSGSMTTANKIQAARNAANLFVNELAGDDQAGYVAFDTDADLREPLAQLNVGGHTSRTPSPPRCR